MRKNAISCCLQFKNFIFKFILHGFRTNPERIRPCGPATLSPNRTMLALQLSAPLFSPVKERHISQTHYLWLYTGLLNRNITDTLQIHSMHLSTLIRERLLSFNDTKIVFLPWSETSADRITIRVRRGPRSVQNKNSFRMSTVENELKMLWAVMQDGKSLKGRCRWSQLGHQMTDGVRLQAWCSGCLGMSDSTALMLDLHTLVWTWTLTLWRADSER